MSFVAKVGLSRPFAQTSQPSRASINFMTNRWPAVAALLANAGRGLGKAFLGQNFRGIRYVLDTNITGTIYLIHKVG
jgi:NADP-dependent 3-hydroxy acid dehydrogenase YdfG